MTSRTSRNKEKRKQIESEERKEKRNHIIRISIKIFFVIFTILTVAFITLRFIGNYGIVVKERVVISEKLPTSFNGLKIVHFSDLHFGGAVTKTKLNKLVKEVNKIKPDIIVFTGDLMFESKFTDNDVELISAAFNNMIATLGKYAIEGNHDEKIFDKIIKNTDFIILNNDYDLIYREGYEPILITGLGSSILKNRDIDKAFEYFTLENKIDDIFTICLLREPDSIDEVLDHYNIDLALAGHSHNGQVRLPFTDALVKVAGAKKYYEEYYKINNTELFISGGIGNSGYSFRLFNHPSINFMRVRN